jgi:hypothetical protein
VLEQPFGDLQAALLQRGVFAGDRQPQLRGCGSTHRGSRPALPSAPAGRRTGRCWRSSRHRRPRCCAGTCPRNRFPSRRQSRCCTPSARCPARCSPRFPCADLAGHLLLLRIEQAAGDRQLRARFQDAHAGRAHVRVGALRLGDQRVEHRVVEVAPPFLGLRRGRRAVPPPAPSASRPTSRPAHGTSGRLKSGPTAAQPPSSSAAARAGRRGPDAPAKHRRIGSGGGGGGIASGRLPRPFRVVIHPAHEDLVAQRQQAVAPTNMPRMPVGRHAAERADQDHRHRRIDAAAEHQRLQDVVGQPATNSSTL